MGKDLHEQLTKYLIDAHSIETQSLRQLKVAPNIADEPAFAEALREHLRETEAHEAWIHGLLKSRGAGPARTKEAVMKADGFVLWARSQPDTPGKRAAHALSYQALEWAFYDLLCRTAERAGEPEVASVARSIRDEERAMMERIEGLLDRAVDASLRALGSDDLHEHLRTYVADAHAIEAQSIQLLESGLEMVRPHPTLAGLFDDHLTESRAQQDVLEERLDALEGRRSLLEDAAMKAGALDWGTFFLGHPDTPAKLAAFAFAFEHLEVGGYEQLRRVAERADDRGTVDAVLEILLQERTTADKLAAAFNEAVSAGLGEER